MSKFNCTLERNEKQNKIIDLEKKYMDKLEEIFTSDDFILDLKKIEKEIQQRYRFLTDVWCSKNKIVAVSERLVKYHIYKKINGSFYTSPISCDIALELNDVILNVDIKTINKLKNKSDMKSTQFEHNQTSFINKPVLSKGSFEGFKVKSNLNTQDTISEKPILTYLIKIIYADDNKGRFNLINDEKFPSLTLTCIPNGLLSELFDNDLFSNFKDYKYFKEKDGHYFKPRLICPVEEFNNCSSFKSKVSLIKQKTDIPTVWEKFELIDKVAFYDKENKKLWVIVPRKWENKEEGVTYNDIYLEVVKEGGTARFNDSWLEERFDSKNERWSGIRKYFEIYKKK